MAAGSLVGAPAARVRRWPATGWCPARRAGQRPRRRRDPGGRRRVSSVPRSRAMSRASAAASWKTTRERALASTALLGLGRQLVQVLMGQGDAQPEAPGFGQDRGHRRRQVQEAAATRRGRPSPACALGGQRRAGRGGVPQLGHDQGAEEAAASSPSRPEASEQSRTCSRPARRASDSVGVDWPMMERTVGRMVKARTLFSTGPTDAWRSASERASYQPQKLSRPTGSSS